MRALRDGRLLVAITARLSADHDAASETDMAITNRWHDVVRDSLCSILYYAMCIVVPMDIAWSDA